jgi:aquaporin TIP
VDETPRRYAAEFVGVFVIVFAAAGAIAMDHYTGGTGLVAIALAYGLATAAMVGAVGAVSGGHLNPAVTLAFLVARRIGVAESLGYVLAQLLGAVLAGLVARGLYPQQTVIATNLGAPALGVGVSFGAGVALETVLTFVLAFAFLAAARSRTGGSPVPRTALAAGAAITVGVLAAGPLTGAAMNPARAFGPAVAQGFWRDHLVYWIGPALGGALAGILHENLLDPRGRRHGSVGAVA